MKRNTFAAVSIAVVLVASIACIFYYRSYRQHNSPTAAAQTINVVGEWQLDSMYAPPGASANANIGLLLAAMNSASAKIRFRFNEDSTVLTLSPKDSTAEKYYLKDTTLFIDEGKGYEPYAVKTIAAGHIQLTSKDSTVLVLKKP